MRISAVWYPITDWVRAREFYGGVLGLAEIHRHDETELTADRHSTGVGGVAPGGTPGGSRIAGGPFGVSLHNRHYRK